jgi:hypothetical protein
LTATKEYAIIMHVISTVEVEFARMTSWHTLKDNLKKTYGEHLEEIR